MRNKIEKRNGARVSHVLLKHEVRSNVGKIKPGREWPEQRGIKDLQAQIDCLAISSKCSRD